MYDYYLTEVLVDFCAGGGHLGLLIAYLNPEIAVCLIENKEESLDNAIKKVHDLDLHNVTLYQVSELKDAYPIHSISMVGFSDEDAGCSFVSNGVRLVAILNSSSYFSYISPISFKVPPTLCIFPDYYFEGNPSVWIYTASP